MSAPTTTEQQPERHAGEPDLEVRPPRWTRRVGGSSLVPLAVTALVLFAAPMVVEDFRLSLLSRFLAFAILAVGLDVAWGYGGMLSLGHGVFFGLGGYAMAMHLKLEASGQALPDFMGWSGVTSLPWWWAPFGSVTFTLLAVLVLPALVAGLLGWMVFRNRIRGAYFAILTQALVLIFVTVLVSRQGYTGGTNGITNLPTVFGLSRYAPETGRYLYWACAVGLLVALASSTVLVRSRFGRLLIACRDGEDRVRFLGFDPTWTKTLAFAFSGALAGLAGALYVPVVGIIAPGVIGFIPSIQMVIWVALGGRATLYGPAVGAVLFGYAQTTFAESYPSSWLYLQGALLILVLMVVPRGLAGVADLVTRVRSQRSSSPRGVIA
jgi:urea transport system permease protein